MNRINDFKDRFAQGPTAAAAGDPAAKLRELKALHDAGVLTQDEFEAKKQDLLARM